MGDIAYQVRETIAEEMGVDIDEVPATASLVDDLGADSFDIVELAMAAEDRFDIDITDEALAGVTTVQDFIDIITEIKGE